MKSLAVCGLLALLALPGAALEPYLVKDISTVPGPSGSDPSHAVTFGGAVFFFAEVAARPLRVGARPLRVRVATSG